VNLTDFLAALGLFLVLRIAGLGSMLVGVVILFAAR
jgi:hypothetical protein